MTTAVRTAPHIRENEAARIAAEMFGIDATPQSLPSERDQNFLFCTASGVKYVLKIANASESEAMLEMQNSVIEYLHARVPGLDFPRIVLSKSGERVGRIDPSDGGQHLVRLVTWVEGRCFADVGPHRQEHLTSLGYALAKIDRALADFDHPAAHRVFHWDLRHAELARGYVNLLPESRQAVVARFWSAWEGLDWQALRFSTIHNDANDYNVLVNADGRVNSILDYGDMVYSATVCDLAVALAYVMLGKSDAIGAAAQVVAAYNEINPLTNAEADSLYTLAAMRLCMSVCHAAHQTPEEPANEYLNISNAPAWLLLEKLATIPAEWPREVFRFACGLPVRALPKRSISRDRLAALREKRLGPSLSLSYRSPLHIVAGSRQYLYDQDGRRYLDCVNNVAHVGHSHPYVVRAASEQMAQLNTNTRYLHENVVEYAQRLVGTLPERLRVVYLVNSGSEANELALRLARTHTQRRDVVVVDVAYHGNTGGLIEISPYKFNGPGGRGKPEHVHVVPMPDVYRGQFRGSDAGSLYAAKVKAAAGCKPAAFICESAPSCGGQIVLPPGYLAEAFDVVRAAGGVCISDEVQTGFGRPGSQFWMFQMQGVVPDIVTLGKPIGNGHPLGAVITTPEIAASFANGMEYFNTFGGNPVSCAVGLAVLDVIRNEELQHNALEVGSYLAEGLRQLQAKYPLMGDVRGVGLFLGIELVRNHSTLEPADRESTELIEQMKDRRILLSIDGPLHNVIKIKPPLVFSRADADFLLEGLDSVLGGR
jgi:4-aminobutyrate aminotransferase-like enzyme/Ser/Thr protein kinase RdoA (MazF antagonist)